MSYLVTLDGQIQDLIGIMLIRVKALYTHVIGVLTIHGKSLGLVEWLLILSGILCLQMRRRWLYLPINIMGVRCTMSKDATDSIEEERLNG